MKRILTTTAMMVFILTLTGCQLYTHDYREDVFEYAMITESADLSQLDQYPNLQYVDLRGSTCYEEILAYATEHPNVNVRYNVQLGQKRFEADVTEIALYCYETNYDVLLQNLRFLPDLRHVQLDQLTFTMEQMDALAAAYPDISFTYTVELCGRRYDHTVTELDLAHLTGADIEDAINAISLLPQLTAVNLVNGAGESNLNITDVNRLSDAFPELSFHYEFTLYGQKISTLADQIIFDSVEIGNEGIDQIREVLGIMAHCSYLRIDSCGVDDETMAQLRSDYPEITVAWRVFAGKFSILTDEEMLRMPFSLTDEDAQVLKYCNSIKYLDVVNSKITNIDFVTHMPDLECAIFTLTKIKDLSPLSGCPNLTWL